MVDLSFSIIFFYTSSTVLLVLGVILLSIIVPKNLMLYNYRIARRTMAAAYLLLAVIKISECLFLNVDGFDNTLYKTIVLAIAFSQAFLFTFALITLINIKFFTRRKVLCECGIIGGFILACAAVKIFLPEKYFDYGFYLLAICYVFMLLRYTHIFRYEYRHFTSEIDNYFSNTETERLKWINSAFYFSLTIGVVALLTCFFPHIEVDIGFSLCWIIYYIVFSIQFINYAFYFQTIENALENENTDSEQNTGALQQDVEHPLINTQLLQTWIDEKKFTQTSITIKDVVEALSTNRTYLSTYINQNEQKTFHEWINTLRIKEAKRLIAGNPELKLWQIAERVGYTDGKYFSVLFKKETGKTPSEYKETGFI